MAGQASTFAQALKAQKEAFLSDLGSGRDLSKWIIAVGNEAGDLDSMASAMGYAHFASLKQDRSIRQFVPLILTSRSDLYLRPENIEALSSAGVTNESLLTLDDIPSRKLHTLGASFALVDHNVLLPPFRSAPESVVDEEDDRRVIAIIDHHADEGRHLAASPRLISPVGSCASLVASHFTSFSPSLPSSSNASSTLPTPLVDLLLSAILIDTGLRPLADGGKATETDLSAVDYLLPFSSFASSPAGIASSASSASSSTSALEALKARNDFLARKKNDVAHLGGRDLLRRDYKEYQEQGVRYGLSTVPLALGTWLDKGPEAAEGQEGKKWDQVLEEIRAWMDERKLDLAGVLTSYTHIKRKTGEVGKHRRELLVLARDGDRLASVFSGLVNDPILQLEGWSDAKWYGGRDEGREEGGKGREGEVWKVWQQGNRRATRKQVAPVLKQLVVEAAGDAQ
ncbi:hypothetical protein JCM11251_002467 [Rhodosporidiobolus azoricus]